MYGQIWIDGVTTQSGATPGLKAWLGFGPSNAPPDAASWTWTPADFNVDVGNNDECWTNIAVASSVTPGVYAYCYKYQYDTNELPSDVRYGLKDGIHTLATYDLAQAGMLTVVPEPGVWLSALCAALLPARRTR